MKIFDRFITLAERHLPDYVRHLLDQARLFDFPGDPAEVLQTEYSDEEREFIRESFFLPFPTVAIEDETSCIILMDRQEDVTGLSSPRVFLECLPFDSAPGGRDGPEVEEAMRQLQNRGLDNACVITMGLMEMFPAEKSRWFLKGSLTSSWTLTPDKVIISAEEMVAEWKKEPVYSRESLEAVLPNVSTAMQEIIHFNNPDRFIIEDKPNIYDKKMRQRRKHKKKRVIRSNERPIYVFATPEEAREKFGFASATGKIGHARRKHYRKLRSDCFARDEKGDVKKVVVKASWIGPEEVPSKNGKRRYKVLLDI